MFTERIRYATVRFINDTEKSREFKGVTGTSENCRTDIDTTVLLQVNLPRSSGLVQKYLGPFNPSTAISYSVASETGRDLVSDIVRDGQLSAVSNVTLKVFDILGREVKALVEERETAGRHVVYWDGTDRYGRLVATGVYYFRLTTLSGSITKKGVLIK